MPGIWIVVGVFIRSSSNNGVLSPESVLIYHVFFLSFKKVSSIPFLVHRQRPYIDNSILKRGDVLLFHLKFLDNYPGGRMILLLIHRVN